MLKSKTEELKMLMLVWLIDGIDDGSRKGREARLISSPRCSGSEIYLWKEPALSLINGGSVQSSRSAAGCRVAAPVERPFCVEIRTMTKMGGDGQSRGRMRNEMRQTGVASVRSRAKNVRTVARSTEDTGRLYVVRRPRVRRRRGVCRRPMMEGRAFEVLWREGVAPAALSDCPTRGLAGRYGQVPGPHSYVGKVPRRLSSGS